ncbi:TrmH family RNA methyltransferase [Oceanobacillus senegalensis]|uniref:TrmH family RNA methyltransferase n=1 Tax=Oceanobacillus senegalensis TaxID=1936063 RepID=UPI000A306C2E|nr:RNA methyltransferase [Oceanobacillus senegalensis]
MITSLKNEKVKSWKKLHKRKERKNTGVFLIEGIHLLEEAWNSDWQIKEVIIQEDTIIPEWCRSLHITTISKNVFEHISQTKTPQGIAAVVEIKQIHTITGNHLLLIDSIQDPGNLGTMIRTADAAGFNGIILGEGTVDLFNDKVIRSTQGSIFHIPIYERNLKVTIPHLKQDGFAIWATALENAVKYNECKIDEKVAIIMGNEGAGVNKDILAQSDKIVNIPIYGKAESLNVSIAAGILMYYIKG